MMLLNKNSLYNRISNNLIKIKLEQKYRKRYVLDHTNCKLISYNGEKYLNFSSNDYFGLSKHPYIISAFKKGLDLFGISDVSSGHIIGYTKCHNNLERRLAKWLNFDRALLFNSGFSANQSIIKTLVSNKDYIITDKFIHSSIIEASMLSQAKLIRFKHNNLDSLNIILNRKCNGNRLVFTEGVFSMDGDCAPIDSISSITRKYNGTLILDDAHGIGVIGDEGKGSISNNSNVTDILVITFSKAFGINGAAILCSELIAEYLIQHAKDLIYTTAIPSSQVFTINAAMDLIVKKEYLRKKLQSNIKRFKLGMEYLGLYNDSNTAIQPIIIGDNLKTIKISKYLRYKYKIWIKAILPPTVPINSARLRIIINSMHSKKDIDYLIEALYNAKKNIWIV